MGKKVFNSWTDQQLDFNHNVLGGVLSTKIFWHLCVNVWKTWKGETVLKCPALMLN